MTEGGGQTADDGWQRSLNSTFDELRRDKVGMRPSASSPRLARGLSPSNGRRDKVGRQMTERRLSLIPYTLNHIPFCRLHGMVFTECRTSNTECLLPNSESQSEAIP